MKKVINYILIAVILLSGLFILTGCSSNKTETKLTAEDVVNKLKEKNTNVGTYVVYTEETDLNELLGRPNQYTSKVTFEDTRLEQRSDDSENKEPVGGTVEVFNNADDMQKRKDYVASITSSMAVFAEYSYSNEYILLRLNKGLTPSQASEYETILNEIFN